MVYLQLENVSKSYGDKILFDNISLLLNQGEKIALVAQNGSGKTTLLEVLAGIQGAEGENAKVYLKKDITIGYLPQEPAFVPGQSIIESIFDSDNPVIQAIKAYEEAIVLNASSETMQKVISRMEDLKAWDFEAKIKEILSKLNIQELNKAVDTLSGGQKKRLALARILIQEPALLILDEPTNHLDLDMIEWLEQYLSRSSLTLFMVTHDRYFLERVCDAIVELDKGNIYRHKGNYSAFLESKMLRYENEAISHEKSKKLYKKELEWIRRMPKARGTKAKARVDKFHQIKDKAFQEQDNQEMLIEMKGSRLGSKILELQYVSKAYGDKKLVDNFYYKFNRNEKVGIIGPNGVGKTTFIKLLTQEVRPDSGKIVVGGTVVFGHYTQDGLPPDDTRRVIDVVRDVAEYIPLEKGMKLTAEQLLERFLFNRKQQQVVVSQLSGGERRRLKLLTVLMDNPNFLILDEPTNDLDIVTLNVLESFLQEFPGCLVVVTHDRYFMDKLVDHLFIFEGEGKIRDFNGTYSEYRDFKSEELEKQRQITKANTTQKDRPATPPKSGLSHEDRKAIRRLENQISKLESKKEQITEAFNDTSLTADQINDLSEQLGKINEEIEEKELAWMELAEKESG